MILLEIYDEYDLIHEQYSMPVIFTFNTFDEALPIIKISVEQGKAVIINTEEK